MADIIQSAYSKPNQKYTTPWGIVKTTDNNTLVSPLGPVHYRNDTLITGTGPIAWIAEENEIKTVLVTLEYRFEGSSATLVKETEHTVKIISSPISVSLEIPDEIVSNQEIELVVKIESDTNNLTKNLLLNISYPFGLYNSNCRC